MPALYTLDRLRSQYADLFDKMEISNSKRAAAKSQALKIIRNKESYKLVEKRTGIPWFVVGCIHFRESPTDREGNPRFDTYLGNGDPLSHATVNVPKGRGPFKTFEDGAYDALITVENLEEIKDWSGPECAAYAFEKINGFAYRNPSRNIPSPYLWGGTNLQKPGKFIRDHVYDARVMDPQLGAMATLRMLMDLDTEVAFAGANPVAWADIPDKQCALSAQSPRADDTESNVKPLIKSQTIWSSVGGWVTSNTTAFFGFIDTHPQLVLAVFGVSSIFLFLVITGRINVQNVVKHLSIADS